MQISCKCSFALLVAMVVLGIEWSYLKRGRRTSMFNENLKTLRKDRGFSQAQMAARLNVVRQTVSKWENGLSVPDAEMIMEIAEVLNVSVSDLLGTNIEPEEKDNSLEMIACELAKLNELLVIQHRKSDLTRKKMIGVIAVILMIVFVCAIYSRWNDMFYNFGKNLYHLFH